MAGIATRDGGIRPMKELSRSAVTPAAKLRRASGAEPTKRKRPKGTSSHSLCLPNGRRPLIPNAARAATVTPISVEITGGSQVLTKVAGVLRGRCSVMLDSHGDRPGPDGAERAEQQEPADDPGNHGAGLRRRQRGVHLQAGAGQDHQQRRGQAEQDERHEEGHRDRRADAEAHHAERGLVHEAGRGELVAAALVADEREREVLQRDGDDDQHGEAGDDEDGGRGCG